MLYQDVVSAFVIAKRAANRSPKTIKWYRDQLFVFGDWIENADMEEISTFDIESYMVEQRESSISDSTLHARYRSLRALFNWAYNRGHIQTNPIAQVEEPSQERKRPEHVTLDEFYAVLDAIAPNGNEERVATWIDHRDRLICQLLFWSGIRSAELIGMKIGDIHLATHTATVRGKGNEERTIPIGPETPAALTAYLYSRPEWAGHNLILASDGFGGVRGLLTDSGLRQMLRRRCQAAGIPIRLPHSWRHGFAILMLNYGAEMGWLKDVMGHKDEKTTRLYAFWLDLAISRRFATVYDNIPGRNVSLGIGPNP